MEKTKSTEALQQEGNEEFIEVQDVAYPLTTAQKWVDDTFYDGMCEEFGVTPEDADEMLQEANEGVDVQEKYGAYLALGQGVKLCKEMLSTVEPAIDNVTEQYLLIKDGE